MNTPNRSCPQTFFINLLLINLLKNQIILLVTLAPIIYGYYIIKYIFLQYTYGAMWNKRHL